jgi:hypothetical protein
VFFLFELGRRIVCGEPVIILETNIPLAQPVRRHPDQAMAWADARPGFADGTVFQGTNAMNTAFACPYVLLAF